MRRYSWVLGLGLGARVSVTFQESKCARSYNTPADVWALGCVLTCIWNNSEYPYPRHELDEPNVVGRVISGALSPTVLRSTDNAIYGFVRDCCQHTPERRTDAAKLETQLTKAARMCSLSNLCLPDAIETAKTAPAHLTSHVPDHPRSLEVRMSAKKVV